MKNHLKNGIIGTAIAGISLMGGIEITSEKIDELEAQIAVIESEKSMLISEVASQKAVKEKSADAYLYAMISSGRKPALNVMPLNDLQASYIRTVGSVEITDKDLFEVGVKKARIKNDFICP